MPLQIRRGTEAERIAMVPRLANGELLWTTDGKKLYVGDGTTASSLLAPVSGFNTEDAQDAVSTLFTTATHSNISFAYDDLAATLTGTVNLSDYRGVIKADAFKGSVFADDGSTIAGQPLVDAISGTFNGNLVGNVTGNVTGNIFTNLIDSADSSSITITPTAIFSSDVTIQNELTVDNIITARSFNGILQTPTLRVENSSVVSIAPTFDIAADRPVFIGIDAVPNTLVIQSGSNFALCTGLTDGTNSTGIQNRISRGTLTAKEAVQPGDAISITQSQAWDGSNWVSMGGYGMFVDLTKTVDPGSIAGSFGVALVTKASTVVSFSFNSTGVLNAPILKATGYPTGSLPSSPEEGWIVFDSSTKQFKGWNGSSWAVLG